MPRAKPLVLLPNHPSATVVRIGTVTPYGYYVTGTFDSAMKMWTDAQKSDTGIAVFEIASSEGVKTAVHHSQIVSIIDVRTRS